MGFLKGGLGTGWDQGLQRLVSPVVCTGRSWTVDNENKNKTWHVFEQENIMEENNGVLMNFLERKSMAILANHDASDFCR